jgi:predicted Zn-dependent protease
LILVRACVIALVLLFPLSFSTVLNLLSIHYTWLAGDVQAESKHHHNSSSDHSTKGAGTRHSHQLIHSLRICCTWNSQVINGQLTYKITGGTKSERQAVNSAADAWMKSVNGLSLVQVTKYNPADIIIGFQSAAEHNSGNGIGTTSTFGDTVGQTSTYFDSGGHIAHAVVTIATAAFGNNIASSQLKQIAMHELGHTLGLGHANFGGDLMSPVINPGTDGISKCDINGVMHAEQWLAGAGVNGTPTLPQVEQVNC